jgi:hypothetical protein
VAPAGEGAQPHSFPRSAGQARPVEHAHGCAGRQAAPASLRKMASRRWPTALQITSCRVVGSQGRQVQGDPLLHALLGTAAGT